MGDMLSAIVDWGATEERIRAMILTGSRAGKEPIDELSDYDIALFVTDAQPYTVDDRWMSSIDDVWICVHASAEYKNEVYPTRLVIFRGGIKVDFSFLSVEALKDIAGQDELPEAYDLGYKELLDKTGLCEMMPAPSFKAYRGGRPTRREFSHCVNEFWFEAYHIPKYLKRGDLWPVKFRAWAAKSQLIRMIEWHERARHNWDYRTHPLGKQMESWVAPETWRSLHQCFGHFDAEDSWDAMFETFKLFGRVARETAKLLAYAYPEEVEKRVVTFAERLRTQS
jgi:aminoglycoside 6-adenylyltransferase